MGASDRRPRGNLRNSQYSTWHAVWQRVNFIKNHPAEIGQYQSFLERTANDNNSRMKFFVGTSGYSYKEWKGSFYPEKFPDKQMLSYYAQQFSTVEINNTFYRLPSESTVQSWAEQVPDTFRFVLKARQVITHFRRLENVERETGDFLRIASALQQRLGPVLYQLPPNFKKDVSRLKNFLKLVDGILSAFEFRHESWFDDEVLDCLSAHSCALCVAEGEGLPNMDLISTTNWGYVRLRQVEYDDEYLKQWVKRIRSQDWNEAYVFFKHEDTGTGPKLACRLLELINEN
jgi:uncharacterized protein YecE (DUF72 family)